MCMNVYLCFAMVVRFEVFVAGDAGQYDNAPAQTTVQDKAVR